MSQLVIAMGEIERHPVIEQKRLKLYKSTLKLNSVSASAWQADTVFGHLCWFLVRRDGDGALEEFLTRYSNGLPPILISDGFPTDYLPSLQLPRANASTGSSKSGRINHQRAEKEKAHLAWLRLDEFNNVRRGLPINPSPDERRPEQKRPSRMIAKNQIDRMTNTAGSEMGELYDMEELILPQVTIYWRIENEFVETVRDFLNDLKQTGYGKRKSIGYGQVDSFTLEEFDGFTDVPDANGFVTLSRFVPAPRDPTDGYWKAIVKYGKLGEEFAVAGNPFKRPLVQLECGSCFRDANPREWYGQLVSGLSEERKEVKQYGFAFALPVRLPEGA